MSSVKYHLRSGKCYHWSDIPHYPGMGRSMRHPWQTKWCLETAWTHFVNVEWGAISDELFINAFIHHARPQCLCAAGHPVHGMPCWSIFPEIWIFSKCWKSMGLSGFIYWAIPMPCIWIWVNKYMMKHHGVASLDPWFGFQTYYSTFDQ